MKFARHPFIRKLFLLSFLAVAGIVVGKVFTYLTRPSAEDLLADIKAEKVLSQSLYVNGRSLQAEVWQVPEVYSTDPLRKAAERLLVVGKTVYVFKEDVAPLRGACTYPSDLPQWDVTCEYVIETGNLRAVIGGTSQTARSMMEMLDGSARAMGWSPLHEPGSVPYLWKKDGKMLWARVKEFARGQQSQAVLIEQKEMP